MNLEILKIASNTENHKVIKNHTHYSKNKNQQHPYFFLCYPPPICFVFSVLTSFYLWFVGVLSSFVLFITSFPDYDIDKAKGRKTLVISLGLKRSCTVFWLFPIIVYTLTIVSVILDVFPLFCISILLTFPLIIKSGKKLKTF